MKKTVFILCTLLLCALSHITMEATEVQPWSGKIKIQKKLKYRKSEI